MRLPYFRSEASRSRQQVLQWQGIQYGRTSRDGELTESLNLSAREYPALCQRLGRHTVTGYDKPTAAFAKDKLIVVDGTTLYYDGKAVGTVTEGEKQIVAVNSYIIVFPDKVCYNYATGQFSSMAVDVTIPAENITFGTDTITVTAEPAPGKTLADIFAVNQAVEITGCSITENNYTNIIRAAEGNTLTFYADSYTAGPSSTPVHIKRNVPDLLYITEHANRLWGCDETTIWASALGDPLTFYNYDGLSTDSYAVSLGTEGRFTGIIGYSANLLVFEENAMHRLLGSEPSEYTIYSYTVPGVQQGSHKSLSVVNEVLYYKGAAGVYAYTGGAPTLASEVFGTMRFDSAAGGTDGHTYYISMRDTESGAWGLWTFDTLRGIWLREDDTHGVDIFRLGSELLILSADGRLMKTGQNDSEEGRIQWQATLAPFDWMTPEYKQFTRLFLHLELQQGAYVKVEIKEDQRPWRQVLIHHAEHKQTLAHPIAPNRCHQMQVRLTGCGRCLVRQVTREYVIGGTR